MMLHSLKSSRRDDFNEGHIIGFGWEMRKLSWKPFFSLFLNCSPVANTQRGDPQEAGLLKIVHEARLCSKCNFLIWTDTAVIKEISRLTLHAEKCFLIFLFHSKISNIHCFHPKFCWYMYIIWYIIWMANNLDLRWGSTFCRPDLDPNCMQLGYHFAASS